MAQPNVAREPSMEEILASIRRIIESNEPTTESAASQQVPLSYDDDFETEDTGFKPDSVANDPGLPRQFEQASVSPAQSEQRSQSLADVAARVRAASARQQEMNSARHAQAPAAAAVEAPVTRQEEVAPVARELPRLPEIDENAFAEAISESLSKPQVVAESQRREPDLTFAAVEAPKATPVQPEPEPLKFAPEIQAAAPREFIPVAEPAPQSLPAKIEEAASLLSAEAGAQVAKSFSDLADVFNGIERRSLEDMAQEMLRPMLHEWLDDNLPTLVERLVREEIERVARGPRR